MAYSGTWQQGGYDQNQGSIGYQHPPPDQYNQHDQYNQQNQYSQHDQYNQHNQYNPQDQYNQQNQYNPQDQYNQHNQHDQYNQQPQYHQPDQYNQHNDYTQPNHYDQHQQQQQQQYNQPPVYPQPTPSPQPYGYEQQPLPQYDSNNNHWDHRATHYNNQIAPPQQYHAAHAPAAPPSAIQTYGKSNTHFQYSDLRGTRKALLIGINYFGSKAQLAGCINDVQNIREFLTTSYRFEPANMLILTDDQQDLSKHPTRANIIQGMRWLTAGARPGDDLFLQFSGHGGPVKDIDGDEDDGFDEAIFPVDHDKVNNGKGYIVDDQIHEVCVKPLPQGCRLTAIFDCCHSGSIMDLPYMYSTKGTLKEPSILKDTGSGLMGMTSAYGKGDMASVFGHGSTMLKKAYRHANGHHKKVRAMKSSAADVICFSGCKDVQTSADASISGTRQGAMSHAFKTSLLRYNGKLTYVQLLNAMRQVVADGGYQQKPQLTCCHPLDLDLLFTL